MAPGSLLVLPGLGGAGYAEGRAALGGNVGGHGAVGELGAPALPQVYACNGPGPYVPDRGRKLLGLVGKVKETALQEVEKLHTERRVRVGIGTIEGGIKGIKHTYNNAQDAVKAGEIFKKDRVILEYMGMEIYSSINQMVVNFGDRLTRTVLKQLADTEKKVLAKYYKCKEDVVLTAEKLGMAEDAVRNSLQQVKINTGLDVNDTEDNFKLQFIRIAKKVLENDEKIRNTR